MLLPEDSLVCGKSHVELGLLRRGAVVELIGEVDRFRRFDHRHHRFMILGMTYLLAQVSGLVSILVDGDRGSHACTDARGTSMTHLVQRIVVRETCGSLCSGAIETGNSLSAVHTIIALNKDSCSAAFVSRTTYGASVILEIVILLLDVDTFVDALCLSSLTFLEVTSLATHLMLGSLITKVTDAHWVDLKRAMVRIAHHSHVPFVTSGRLLAASL